jgi:hypothetical protein
MIIMNLKGSGRSRSWTNLRHILDIQLEGLRKTTKTCKGIWCLSRDSKRVPPEYEPEALPLEAVCSVLHGNVTCDKYCHDLGVCDYRRGIEWWMDLMAIYTHHSELQVITALSLVFTFYKSLHPKSSPACSVFNSRFLVTDVNSRDSSAMSRYSV